jgi:hypothetical protein
VYTGDERAIEGKTWAEIIKHLFVNLPGVGYTENEISARVEIGCSRIYINQESELLKTHCIIDVKHLQSQNLKRKWHHEGNPSQVL